MFVNVPIYIIKNIKDNLKKTKHQFIPSNIWINGLITNKSTCFYSVLNKNKKKKPPIKFFLNFKTKSDLIVNFGDENKKVASLIKESNRASIPTISFNTDKNVSIFKPTYFLLNRLNSGNNFFFYTILKSILKKEIELKKNSYLFEKDFYTKKKVYIKKHYKNFKHNKQNFRQNKHNFKNNKQNFFFNKNPYYKP